MLVNNLGRSFRALPMLVNDVGRSLGTSPALVNAVGWSLGALPELINRDRQRSEASADHATQIAQPCMPTS